LWTSFNIASKEERRTETSVRNMKKKEEKPPLKRLSPPFIQRAIYLNQALFAQV
jgi:hypothetical protein